MPFGEGKREKEIGSKEKPKDIESIRKEIKEKYPNVYEIYFNKRIELLKRDTAEIKEKYPKLLEELNDYAKRGRFKEILIIKKELSKIIRPLIRVIPPYITFPENYFSPLRKIKGFAPDFFAKGIKTIFGTQGIREERISGHEKEHLRGPAFQSERQKYAILERVLKEKEIKESLKKEESFKKLTEKLREVFKKNLQKKKKID